MVAGIWAAAACLWAAPARADQGARRILAGDRLNISVEEQADLSRVYAVAGDGTIDFAFAGRVLVAEMTEDEAAAKPELTTSPRGADGSFSFLADFHVGRDTVLRVTIRNPKGEAVPYYGANLLAPAGKATFIWTPALDDEQGEWSVEFREIVGGKILRATIRI